MDNCNAPTFLRIVCLRTVYNRNRKITDDDDDDVLRLFKKYWQLMFYFLSYI